MFTYNENVERYVKKHTAASSSSSSSHGIVAYELMSNRAVGVRVNVRCPEGANALLHASEHVGPIGGVHKMHRLLVASDIEKLV